MVFLRRNGQDIPETGAFTILKNVRVFAVNTNTERATDAKGETANFRTVSLLVKPDHARELVVAAQMGKIMLTLRRPDEKDELRGEEVTPLDGHPRRQGRSWPASPAAATRRAGRVPGLVKDSRRCWRCHAAPATADAGCGAHGTCWSPARTDKQYRMVGPESSCRSKSTIGSAAGMPPGHDGSPASPRRQHARARHPDNRSPAEPTDDDEQAPGRRQDPTSS